MWFLPGRSHYCSVLLLLFTSLLTPRHKLRKLISTPRPRSTVASQRGKKMVDYLFIFFFSVYCYYYYFGIDEHTDLAHVFIILLSSSIFARTMIFFFHSARLKEVSMVFGRRFASSTFYPTTHPGTIGWLPTS